LIYIYFIVIFLIGICNTKNIDRNDYFYLSRKLTLPSFIATIVTTWYGGILEIGRYSYVNGIVTWIIFGFFYYLSAILFALYIGPKFHKNNIESIPRYFKKTYGIMAEKLSSIVLILLSSPAPYLMILSTLLMHIFNITLNTALIFGIMFSIAYIYSGGLKSIISTDILQFVFMYLGFFTMLIYLIYNFGGMEYLINNVPDKNLTLTGNLPIGYIFSWSLIAMIIFIDPSIFQRAYSTKDVKTLQKGLVISIGFWFIFDILAISIGLYASAIIDASALNGINPYLYLADNYLPIILKNIFYIGLLSVVMSTIDSFFFISSMTISNDLMNNKKKSSNKIALILTGIISYIIAINFDFVIDIWYIFGSIAASALLIPLLIILFKPNRLLIYPATTLSLPIFICLLWIYLGYPYNIDIMYPGITTSALLSTINKEIQ